MTWIETAKVALRLGGVGRATHNPFRPGTHENVAEHTLMLAYAVWAFCANSDVDVSLDLAIRLALVHDATEAWTGDTPTLNQTPEALLKKAMDEAATLASPEFSDTLGFDMSRAVWVYEGDSILVDPERAVVNVFDKILPMYVAAWTGCQSIFDAGIDSVEALNERLDAQHAKLRARFRHLRVWAALSEEYDKAQVVVVTAFAEQLLLREEYAKWEDK